MIRVYVILYFICIYGISELFQNVNARPNNNNNNNNNKISINESDDDVQNSKNDQSIIDKNNLNINDIDQSIYKRSIVIYSTKNCDKIDHKEKCMTNKVKKPKTSDSDSKLSTIDSSLSNQTIKKTTNYDRLVHEVPIMSQNIAEFLKI